MRPALYPVLFGNRLRPVLDLLFTSGTLDPRVTYSGASLATLTDATGAIAYKPHNLLTYSEQFDNAAWSTANGTVVANQSIDPNGITSADLLYPTTTGNDRGVYRSIALTSGVAHTYSVYVKAAGFSFIALAKFSGSGYAAWFNVSSGAVSNIDAGYSASIVAAANGFYRCTITGPASATTYAQIITADAAASIVSTTSGTNGVYLWGAQLNVGPLQPYYPTTSAAYYGPRFTYDPVTHAALGLLIEEQRTNLLTYSEAFDNAAWTKNGGASVTANVATAPDGNTTADRLTVVTGSSDSAESNGFSITSGTTYTGSVFLQIGTSTTVTLNFSNSSAWSGAVNPAATFNLSTGAMAGLAANTTATATAYPGGWWRFTITATAASTVTSSMRIVPVTAASTTLLWGAQLEAGAFATSYIPTTSASVTRAADSATMTGSNFSSWFNATQGTFVVEWTPASNSGRGIVVSDGTFSNYLEVLRLNTFSAGAYVGPSSGDAVVGGGAYASGQFAAGEVIKSAAGYGPGGLIAAQRGASASAAAPTFSGMNSLRIGVNSPNTTAAAGGQIISRLRYYNTALTNAQLQALTT